ncbi:MAG: YidE/YbjL duplication [Proteobacteria bacterium]|nr:MAG: YidE/YbjL duplication [Pseudomonadota bacterium]
MHTSSLARASWLALPLVLLGSCTGQAAEGASVSGSVEVLLGNPLLLTLVIIAAGMALGAIRLWGISLGSSGVLFAGLVLGHLGRDAEWAVPDGIGSFGLVLFVYAVGLGAGSTFFRAFRDQGRNLAILAVVTVGVGALTAIGVAELAAIPGDLAAGLFAGSLTSTPALAAGIQAAQAAGSDGLAVSIGYGVAYPVGVVAVVVFAQLLPKVLRQDLDALASEEEGAVADADRIDRFALQVLNPAIFGKRVKEVPLLERLGGQITRVLEGDRLVPIKADHRFELGQIVLLIADAATAEAVIPVIGRPAEAPVIIDSDHDRGEVVVTSPDVLATPLRDLHLRSRFGVTVARIERYGVSFVPSAEGALSMGDRVTVVGEPKGLEAFARAAGHRARKADETSLVSIAAGVSVGIVLGLIPITVPGLGSFALGMAGGPLIVGLLFAHYGRVFGLVGYMPAAARFFTQELGLTLFLAAASFSAGAHLSETLATHGALPFALAAAVALVTMAVAYVVARYVLKMGLLRIIGGTCGAMTSTAGIGAIVAQTDSDAPVTSYAAAYPVALVLMTAFAQLVVALVGP